MWPALLVRVGTTALTVLGLDHVVREWVRGDESAQGVVVRTGGASLAALALAAGAGALAVKMLAGRRGRR